MEKSPYYLVTARIVLVIVWILGYATVALSTEPVQPTAGVERKASSGELSFVEGFSPPSGTYHYDVFLQGAKLGRATIAVDGEAGGYRVAVTARTRGVLKYLYRVKYRGEVKITSDPLEPSVARIVEHTGNKEKRIHAEFEKPNKIVATEEEIEGDSSPKVKTKEYDSESFILDPFSTVFLIRSLDWELGTAEVFDVFTGTKQYELYLLCVAEEAVDVGGKVRLCWVITPETRTLEKPQEIKMSGFRIYLSKDERKEIVKIVGHPKIGRIVANLRKFEKRTK